MCTLGAARPAVVTEVGGNPEIVVPGKTGMLVPRGDANAVGDALAHVLAQPKVRRNMGEAGRERALAMFSQDRMHRAWSTLYADAARTTA